jgi:hypothetical protein
MADPSDVDAALLAKLTGDTTLMGLMTDGVHLDVAPSGKTKFVILSLSTHEDDYVFEGSAFERSQYIVKAVERSNSGTNVKAAAARIHALLQDVALTITGYTHSMTRRAERIRYTEVDELDADIRWQHRGGRYDVFVSP